MKSYREILFLLSIAGCIFLYGCPDDTRTSDWSTDPPPDEVIAKTNEIRKKLGVRQIQDDWTFYGRQFGEEKWKDANGDGCKVVVYNENYEDILREYDTYRSGRTFQSLDPDGGIGPEFLAITYDYQQKRFAISAVTDNWEIKSMIEDLEKGLPDLRKGKDGGYDGLMGKTNEETLEVVDKIFKMWGLKRL